MNLSPLPLAVFVVDATGTITSWNRACEKLAGYGAADIRNCSLDKIIAFDDAANVSWVGERVNEDSTGDLICADGHRVPVRVTVAPQSLDPDNPGGFSVIVVPRTGLAPTRYALIQDLPIADIIEELPCVFYVIDQSGHLLLWNHQLEDALEMASEELPTLNVKHFFDGREQEKIVDKILEAFERGSSTHEAELVGRHGKRTPFLFHCARASLGSLPVVFGTGLDISARKEAERGLRVRERAMYASVNAILITCCAEGADNVIEYVNPAFEQITGYTLAEVKGRNPRFMRVDDCDLHEQHRIHDAVAARQSVRAVLRNRRKNGEIFWNDLRIDPVTSIEGDVTHFVGVINDITEARHYERRLQHLAHHDALTGLANRTLLLERLKAAIDAAAGHRRQGALAFLDLDNFKHINDTFGHDAGDAVLREIAARLRDSMREEDTVARLGGDEFVLVIAEQSDVTQLACLVERIRQSVSAPIVVDGKEILPGTSIGVSLFPQDGRTVDQVMRAADAAMYHAKTLGRNNVQFYSEELNQVVHQHLLLEASLSRAIRNRELVLGYQPKVDLRTGKVVGAEALVRWQHPVDGIIAPDVFIPVAEQTGLIVPLGDWVLDEACATLRTLAAVGIEDFVIAVNLSARQLRQRRFVNRLAETLARHGVPARRLELEVTESQLMDHPEEAREALAQLKLLGVRLSIDDFGTGYSSLSHLQKFPVDCIKIDRSFLGGVSDPDDGHEVITRAIIALGHNLKLQVIAEGVETIEQLTFLRDHDCDQMQGYYFSPALAQDGLQEMLRRDARLPM
ncbi:EAL domain-containing protein [Telluria mixta]|uniref:EAL domain-containing protein n=1 Tax=Telluria mixta TaxID=34071 RepID=A0ABT2BY67_9BURK|nr:EAL domain-containing protein [Telluria mixta]MCS0630075.1 EAL domain-containing protein [Telluria mixta]WEM94612.1 EAL domain-containing protein [Telluria mixta]